MSGLRLVDGSETGDWKPSRGDAPCDFAGHVGHSLDECFLNHLPDCECGRQPVSVCAFTRNTSLLIRRIGDMGYQSADDWRCTDCVADMADQVAASSPPPFHADFNGGAP